jgi:uncharacterized OB-fold protein
MADVLSAPYAIEFTYTRSVGPVLERFFIGLGQRRVEGIVGVDGRVIVPPQEYDPVTSQELTEFRTVGDEGVVTTWGWINEPLTAQPLQHPFAWALIQLDGADVPFLHAVDAGDESRMSTGMRVKVRWAPDAIEDFGAIECFEPAGGAS